MKTRRALAALALLGLAFTAQASCASVLGIDEDSLDNVVVEMCKCPGLAGVNSCESTLGDRLDDGAPATREAWLARYRDERCDKCENMLKCLSTKPTCTIDECVRDEVCCPAAGASKGVCVEGSCKREPLAAPPPDHADRRVGVAAPRARELHLGPRPRRVRQRRCGDVQPPRPLLRQDR